MRYILVFFFFVFSFCGFSQIGINGLWHSAFTVMGQSVLMDLSVDIPKKEVYLISLDSEPKATFPCVDISYTDNHLQFQWLKGNLKFDGFYYENGDTISGKMQQNGITWTATFHKEVQERISLVKPQKPVGPFPYTSKEIRIKNPTDGTEIIGTFTYPVDKKSNYPIVIFASGSGPQDRDCSILGHQPFLYLADQLARRGIASFRFDDRGAGMSKASYSNASLTDFGSDVTSCVNFLTKQREFKRHKLGLLGHSEGGMHILLAEKSVPGKVDFMVFLCSVGIQGQKVLTQQQYDIPKRSGLSEEDAKWNSALYDGMSSIVVAEPDAKKADENLVAFLEKMYAIAPAEISKDQTKEEFIASTKGFLNNDWGREFLSFDPANYLNVMDKPALVIFGGSDDQVAYEPNMEGFKTAMKPDVIAKSQFHVLPGLNHLLQKCSTCTVEEYGNLKETMNPIVVEFIIPFIYKQCD